MRIENDIKLDFNDVLLRPKRSMLKSKNDITLQREFTFKYSPHIWKGIPIIASPMDGVGTFSMAKVLQDVNMITAIKDGYSMEEWNQASKYLDFNYIAPRVGTGYAFNKNAEDYKKLKQILNEFPEIKMIVIDVANFYLQSSTDFLKLLRDDYPLHIVICGNVATPDISEQLIFDGADVVRIGIGPGCLEGSSRILMSNGTYKNISDVKPGDRIITITGQPATVKKSFCTGVRKVIETRFNHFYKPLILTPNHKCFIGDLSSVNDNTLSSLGYKKILTSTTKKKESKLKWKEIGHSGKKTCLVPNNIQWELPPKFEYDISSYFERKEHCINYNTTITSTYDLGYMFGFFLGDGNSRISYIENNKGQPSLTGTVTWYLNRTEMIFAEKLQQCVKNVTGKMPTVSRDKHHENVIILSLYSKQWATLLDEFGKKTEKHLPTKYMCLDIDYLTGLYNGLVDSDGHKEGKQLNFTNTSVKLMELFGVLTLMLKGHFPIFINRGKSNSDRVQALNEAYGAKTLIHKDNRKVNNYQIVKILESIDKESTVPVYDLEIDDDTHSFIANNIIVHNSICTTRIKAGVGYPQLSAINECSDVVHGIQGHIVGDGGCASPGDIAKAFGAGADFVMLGSMLAAHAESEEKVVSVANKNYIRFWGMSSQAARERHGSRKDLYQSDEGRVVLLPFRGIVINTIKDILGGLASSMVYIGAKRLKDIPKCATFIRVSNKQTYNTSLEQYTV